MFKVLVKCRSCLYIPCVNNNKNTVELLNDKELFHK